MIRIESLDKSYGRGDRTVAALRGITARIEPGVWGVVGPNGAGKTTLLGLVLGFLRPTGGSITVDDVPPQRYTRRHGVAYLPERFRLPPEWPVGQALLGFARLDGLAPAAARTAVDNAVDRLGLREYADRPFGTLSRGLAQRVGIAQALLADRRLVVLDEPAEGLDPLWRVRLRDIIADLPPDRTVLLASHDLAELERVADRVIVLDTGSLRDILEPTGPGAGPLRYRLVVAASPGAVRTAFPEARPTAESPDPAVDHEPVPGTSGTARDGPRELLVEVGDAGELSQRLAALLDTGATVHEVVPLSADLESRVRERLEDR